MVRLNLFSLLHIRHDRCSVCILPFIFRTSLMADRNLRREQFIWPIVSKSFSQWWWQDYGQRLPHKVADEEIQKVTRTRDLQNFKRPTVTGLFLPGPTTSRIHGFQNRITYKLGVQTIKSLNHGDINIQIMTIPIRIINSISQKSKNSWR